MVGWAVPTSGSEAWPSIRSEVGATVPSTEAVAGGGAAVDEAAGMAREMATVASMTWYDRHRRPDFSKVIGILLDRNESIQLINGNGLARTDAAGRRSVSGSVVG